jgi:hypothetical protein
MLKWASVFFLLFTFSTFVLVMVGQVDLRTRGTGLLVVCVMIYGLVMTILTHEVRCPRCGERFYVQGSYFWQITKRCLHCGQLKYADVVTPPKAGGN